MSTKTLAGDRRRRKLNTALWSLGVGLAVILLIYFEKTAILYILCTVGVAVLMMIVALSDLAHADAKGEQVAQPADAPRVANRER
jgi:hypothetical protein